MRESQGKMLLLVMDGLGGIRTPGRGSELFEAATPNLDRMAAQGSSGVHTVVAPGITPGSGAGHMALFGYDPTEHLLGRGALSAAGVAFDLKPGDIAARVNFCTIDEAGRVTDRRAGRISTEINRRLVKLIMANLKVEAGVEAFLVTERDHRALLVLRGANLSPLLKDTDPGFEGITPNPPTALSPEAAQTAMVLERLLDQIRLILASEKANFILLRGFDTHRDIAGFPEKYRLRARGIAGYPMYLGIARLLGMHISPPRPVWADVVSDLEKSWDDYDFFFLHYKGTDSAGEDGDFDRKCAAIQEVDGTIPAILALNPSVVCVTGDHSTPAPLMRHSWHAVPFVMWGPSVGIDSVERFDEESARRGAFGHLLAKDLMALMLASTGRLATYGA